MNKDIKLIWEAASSRTDEQLEQAAEMIEKIYGGYNTAEAQRYNILDFFNDWKKGSQAGIKEILQRKFDFSFKADPRGPLTTKLKDIISIIGQKKSGGLPPVF
tara:strand:+ start:362 stop:670 length:309 start_codon:yes stop_codon:yes gene_type:complete